MLLFVSTRPSLLQLLLKAIATLAIWYLDGSDVYATLREREITDLLWLPKVKSKEMKNLVSGANISSSSSGSRSIRK